MSAEVYGLVPAAEMAARSPVRFPNESAECRTARTALLQEEIELRRHLARLAEQRKAIAARTPLARPTPRRSGTCWT